MEIKFKEFQSDTYLFGGKTYVPNRNELVKHNNTLYKIINTIYFLPEDELHISLTQIRQNENATSRL